jgi:hypothetical protein
MTVQLLEPVPAIALSVMQPWAWLIVHGHKDVENRTWRTSHRGSRLIHASLRVDRRGDRWIRHHFPQLALPPLERLPRGGIVGQVSIADCVKPHPSQWYAEGQWAFVLEAAKALPFYPLAGRRSFFGVDASVRTWLMDQQIAQLEQSGTRA